MGIQIETTKKPIVGKRFYTDADNKNVATNIVFVNESGSIFYDEAFVNEVPAEDCLELFAQGVVALKGDTYHAAVSCTKAGVINFGL